jgi:hypothetical protein
LSGMCLFLISLMKGMSIFHWFILFLKWINNCKIW